MRMIRCCVVAFLVCGCGGTVRLALKSPVESKCESTGLQGCAELTEGVLLFVEGDRGQGSKKLLEGAGQNAPEKLRAFASAIKDLEKVPGAGDYARPLIEIAKLLVEHAEVQAKAPTTATDLNRSIETLVRVLSIVPPDEHSPPSCGALRSPVNLVLIRCRWRDLLCD